MRWQRCVLSVLGLLLACNPGIKVEPPPIVIIRVQAGEGAVRASPAARLTGDLLDIPGLLLSRNDDDSDGDGSADFGDTVVNGPEDGRQLVVFTIEKLNSTPKAGDTLHLHKRSGVGQLRVFRKEATPGASNSILDTSVSAQTSTAEATTNIQRAKLADTPFWVEGKAAGDVELCAAWTGSANVENCVKLQVRNGFYPKVFGDHERNGSLDPGDEPLRDDATQSALIFVNSDKDCPAGAASQRDFDDTTVGCAPDVGDIGELALPVAPLVLLPAGWKPILRMRAHEAGAVRVFAARTPGSAELSGTAVNIDGVGMIQIDLSGVLSAAVAAGQPRLLLGIEGRKYAVDLALSHCVVHSTGVDAACDRMHVSTGRVLLQSNSEPVVTLVVGDHVYGCATPDCPVDNATMLASLSSGVPAPAVTVPLTQAEHHGDPWVQDEVEIGGQAAPRGNAQVVLHLPRRDDLKAWAEKQLKPDVGYLDMSAADSLGKAQYGGNLEVSPAVGGSQGQLVVGLNMLSGLRTALEKLSPQQAPALELPVGWLSVGHVDEVMTFYPQGTGFNVAVASTALGRQVLDAAKPEAGLFWHCRTATRTRESACFGSGSVTGASAKSGGARARLEAAGFAFDARPSGREWQWLRIYSGTGIGQVAHISKIVDPQTLELDWVWNLPTPDAIRCASVGESKLCDTDAAGLGAPAATSPFWPRTNFRRNDWFTLPAAGATFVVAEDTLDWDAWMEGSAAKGAISLPRGVPALITAHELREGTINSVFLNKQRRIEVILDGIASQLDDLPGSIRRVPALYNAVDELGLVEGEAFVPNVVNFQVVPGSAAVHLFAARPFGPSIDANDPWEAKCNSDLGVTPTYVDDWDVYHTGMGEVHCGTNLFKRAREWWK